MNRESATLPRARRHGVQREGPFEQLQHGATGRTVMLLWMIDDQECSRGQSRFYWNDCDSAARKILGDKATHRMSERERTNLHREKIGFVFQAYHLLDDLTVYENIDLPLSYRNVKRSERQTRVADILD